MLRSVAVGFVVLLTSGSALAEDRYEIGGYGGYLWGGTAHAESPTERITATIESAPSYGAMVDVAVRRGAWAELSYTRQPTKLSLRSSDGTNYSYEMLAQYFQIGGLLEYTTPSAEWLRPVFGGTLGATAFTANDDRASYEEWRFSFLLEAGAKIRLTHFLGLRLRGRGIVNFLTDNSALFCTSGRGCAYAFTGTAMLQGEVGIGGYLSF